MKLLFTVLSALTLSTANASSTFFATHCSNAKGTVKWESGQNSNTITFQTLKGKELKLNLVHVVIKFNAKTMLDIQETNVCGFYSKKETFAGKVEIYPSAQNPRDLTSVSENNEIETDVICTSEITSHLTC